MKQVVCAAGDDPASDKIVEVHHTADHPEMKQTLYFAKRVNPAVIQRQVHAVVTNCEACQSIDPASIKWWKGTLDVERLWQRVGMDIIHCSDQSYLTLIDCGPSCQLRLQTSVNIIEQLEAVSYEYGVPEELLTDNDSFLQQVVCRVCGAVVCVSVLDVHMSHPGMA